jgi:hypothetical protein
MDIDNGAVSIPRLLFVSEDFASSALAARRVCVGPSQHHKPMSVEKRLITPHCCMAITSLGFFAVDLFVLQYDKPTSLCAPFLGDGYGDGSRCLPMTSASSSKALLRTSEMTNINGKEYWIPPQIIQQGIWLYVRSTLRFRDLGIEHGHRTCLPIPKQPSVEFASTSATPEVQDAGVQERWVSPKIYLYTRHDPQHIQRPKLSRLCKNSPSLPGLGDADVARKYRHGRSLT